MARTFAEPARASRGEDHDANRLFCLGCFDGSAMTTIATESDAERRERDHDSRRLSPATLDPQIGGWLLTRLPWKLSNKINDL